VLCARRWRGAGELGSWGAGSCPSKGDDRPLEPPSSPRLELAASPPSSPPPRHHHRDPCSRAPCPPFHASNMSKGTQNLLVSLPASITPSNDHGDALDALRSTIGDNGQTSAFPIPNFKIGTLDALVQQADDLAKLESSCEQVVAKVGDSLKTILDGDDDRVQQHKTINDSAWIRADGRSAQCAPPGLTCV
jgi:hypothetical protein